jgi:RNA polymerase sigma factor (sigma-70 family)
MTTMSSDAWPTERGPAPLPDQAGFEARTVEASLADPARFGLIFDHYFAEIHGYIARRLTSDAADDLAAETFAIAFRQRDRFDANRGIVRGWLYGIATNLIGRYRRREIREYRAIQRTGSMTAADGPAEPADALLAARTVRGQVARALAELSRGDRDVLLLVALGGLSHAEVSQALGIPYGTVGSRLSRVRKKLRTRLSDAGPGTEQEETENG